MLVLSVFRLKSINTQIFSVTFRQFLHNVLTKLLQMNIKKRLAEISSAYNLTTKQPENLQQRVTE